MFQAQTFRPSGPPFNSRGLRVVQERLYEGALDIELRDNIDSHMDLTRNEAMIKQEPATQKRR